MSTTYKSVIQISVILFLYTSTIVQSNECPSDSGMTSNNRIEYRMVGEWFLINCSVKNRAIEMTLWQDENERVVDGKNIRAERKNVFNITKIRRIDEGGYFCKGCNTITRAGYLVVQKGTAFAKPRITKKPNSTVSTYGSVVKLECVVIGELYGFQWFRDGQTFKNEKSRTLNITNVSKKDDGTYMCKITRQQINYSATATAVIKTEETSAPIFLKFASPTVITVRENDNISLSYLIHGTPPPHITWYRSIHEKEEKIASCLSKQATCKTNAETEVAITKTEFNFSNVKYPRDNNARFWCHAENNFGMSSKSITVIVTAKPYISRPSKKKLKYHNGMQINCSLEKANPKNINFTWHSCELGWALCGNKSGKMWKILSRDYAKDRMEKTESSFIISDRGLKKNIIYRCTAQNAIGADQIFLEVFRVFFPASFNKDTSIVFLSIVVPLGSVISVILLLIVFVLYKRMQIYGGFYVLSRPPFLDYIEHLDPSKTLHDQLRKLPFLAEWEFPRERVSLQSELGAGEFASVWLAHATHIADFRPRDMLKHKSNQRRMSDLLRSFRSRNNSYVCCKDVTTVAVKKLKGNWDRGKLMDLRSELKILTHVGEHENIVNILGACTKGQASDLWIIMEYCPHGDIRTFLRHRRDVYDSKESSLANDLSQKLGPMNLVFMACQIAKGMEFLISRKIVHRDLATRNILLGVGYVAKVADFGLSRKVYNYEMYVRKSSNLLPLKWMAIESLSDSIFTEKTDVWSFGILLWELFSLGATPYPEIETLDIYKYLRKGNRMDPPKDCPSEISKVMRGCWKNNPHTRPSFKDLGKMLHQYVSSPGLEISFQGDQKEDSDEKAVGNFNEENDSQSQTVTYTPVIFNEGDELSE